MVAKHRLKVFVVFGRAASIQGIPVAAQRNVQAFLEVFRLVTMAGGAGFTFAAWVGNQASVSSFHIRRLLAAVTIGAGHLTVRGGEEGIPRDEHFLPWLQRSHIAPSANSFGFRAVRVFRLGCQRHQSLLIGVAIQAVINHWGQPGKRG